MTYYTETVERVLGDINSSEKGLAASEAEERLKIFGPNTLKITGDPFWRKLLEPFANSFTLILLAAAGISLFRRAYIDAVIVLVIIMVSAIIYYVQRFSTERVLRSLRRQNIQNVAVRRENKIINILASQLVPGDIILLREGEKVPADSRIITASLLRTNEAQLTGESEPVNKQSEQLHGKKEVYNQSNMLFQGSFVISGEALAVVIATGNNTEFGRMALLAGDTEAHSPVERKIDRLVTQIIGVVAGVSLVVFLLSLGRQMSLLDSLQFVIALSVSAVPESLPVAISVILVLGMRRMAKKKALARSMRSIESIGVVTTIATDKTGTLTKNQLTVHEIWRPENSHSHLKRIILMSINSSQSQFSDPLDGAFLNFLKKSGAKATLDRRPVQPLLFDQSVAMSGNLWRKDAKYELVVKGAPEQILAGSKLTTRQHEEATAQLHKLTASGFRVIALSHCELGDKINKFEQLPINNHLIFDGFVAVADVLRPEARPAIEAALRAGITVRMITGDHFETAYHIACRLGMITSRDQVFDARHMDSLSDKELEEVIEGTRVFSRVTPEHKYRILTLLKKHDITAMTGDGVNDVPALTSSHVGIAMGSGSQIAKDAGDIILLDDNFGSIIAAVAEGRKIYANIRRMVLYLLATNTGEVLTTVGALVVDLPLPLLPVQILWVNLVTDTSMVIPLGLEPSDKYVMRRLPAKPDSPLLNRFMISRIVIMTFIMSSLTLTIYALFSSWHDVDYARTVAFSVLVIMQWANALAMRNDEHVSLSTMFSLSNKALNIGLLVAVILQILVLAGPLGPLLHVSPVSSIDLLITGLIAFAAPIIAIWAQTFIAKVISAKMVNSNLANMS